MQRTPVTCAGAGRHRQRRLYQWCGGFALAVLVGVAAAGRADESQWRDIESRIQYGYYTEDPRALHNLAEAVTADESRSALHGYYAGLVYWRLALLTMQNASAGKGESPGQLAQRCVRALDGALALEADFAEGLALRSACEVTPLSGGGMHVPFAGHGARKDLDRALQLAPRNPRVLLLDSFSDYQLPASMGGNKDRALAKLRRAVAAFEAERGGTEPLPGWGAVDAYLLLGRDLLDHADPVGARDALEHALLLAPEYGQARRLLGKITAG